MHTSFLQSYSTLKKKLQLKCECKSKYKPYFVHVITSVCQVHTYYYLSKVTSITAKWRSPKSRYLVSCIPLTSSSGMEMKSSGPHTSGESCPSITRCDARSSSFISISFTWCKESLFWFRRATVTFPLKGQGSWSSNSPRCSCTETSTCVSAIKLSAKSDGL